MNDTLNYLRGCEDRGTSAQLGPDQAGAIVEELERLRGEVERLTREQDTAPPCAACTLDEGCPTCAMNSHQLHLVEQALKGIGRTTEGTTARAVQNLKNALSLSQIELRRVRAENERLTRELAAERAKPKTLIAGTVGTVEM